MYIRRYGQRGHRLAMFTGIALVSLGTTFAPAEGREQPPLREAGAGPHGANVDAPFAERSGARSDTLDFGFYDAGTGQAVLGEQWTFDHGAPDPLEGWTSLDESLSEMPFRRITSATWDGHTNGVGAPIPVGTGAAWCGRFEDEADADCWADGLGYGNGWNARFISPPLTYTGVGDVALSFRYFTDLELDFDYARLRLLFPDGGERALNYPGITGTIGDPSTGSYALFDGAITNIQFDGYTDFRLVFELQSDGGWSDEDGAYVTSYSGFGFDEVSLSGNLVEGDQHYDFESGDDGFTTNQSEPSGSLIGVNAFASYGVNAPCACAIAGNVLEVHDGLIRHPAGQSEYLYSPPADRASLGDLYNFVFAEYDLWTPVQGTGTYVRPGWSYYPWTCPSTGVVGWSPPMMQNTWFLYSEAGCLRQRFGIDAVGVPGNAGQYRLVFQVINDCVAFGLPENCNDVQEPGPLFDNLRIRVTRVVDAPAITFSPGCYFQDGFGQGLLFSTTNVGNADITFDLHRDDPVPDLLGDSLAIVGPLPTASTQWESRMWWRIRREGPGQPSISGYGSWKTAVSDGLSIVGPNGQFTFGRMDSMQVGTSIFKNRFISEFREDDDDFVGEGANNNEMIRDAMLAPGSQIQYFISANYVGNPANYLLPDTTGRNYLEFEILPSYRLQGGIPRFPCTLTIDLNSGDQRFVEPALNLVFNGADVLDPVPNPTLWDRFDYNDATSNWNAPLARLSGGNNGLPLFQLLQYHTIILYAGAMGPDALESQDISILDEWLRHLCGDDSSNRQGLIVNGHNLTARLEALHPSFVADALGSSLICESYREVGCGPIPADEGDCVRIESGSGALYPPVIEYDVFGNACPQSTPIDVIGAASGGVGNRVYSDYDGMPVIDTQFAQVAKSVTGPVSDNYRSVLDGTSFGHLSTRSVTNECAGEFDRIASAAAAEISGALEWIFGGAAAIPRFCYTAFICGDLAVEDDLYSEGTIAHLFPPTPNPFNPRTTLRFTLPAAGEVQLDIYDVAGRRVRRLVDRIHTAGLHELVWDGTDDRGHQVPPGVYWAQLRAGGVTSNKRLVQVR